MVRTVVLVGVVVFAVACVLLAAGLTRAYEAMRRHRHPDAILPAASTDRRGGPAGQRHIEGRTPEPSGLGQRAAAAKPAPTAPGALVAARVLGAAGAPTSRPRPAAAPAQVTSASTSASTRRRLGNDGASRFARSGPNVRTIRSLNRA